MAVLGAVLLVFSRDTGASGVESCGPQTLTYPHEGSAVQVDSAGCPVDLYVWSYEGTPDSVFVLPQDLEGLVSGTGPLTLQLPCGGWQVDVFNAGQFDLGPKLTQEDFTANPRLWFDLLAGDHGYRVCKPGPQPHKPVVPAAVPPAAAPPVPAAPPAPVAPAEPYFAG
jgi:hypothetical protein